MRIPDSKVTQLAALLDETGILPLIDAELAGRPGPSGLPVRTVLIGLMLAIHYTGKATLAEAWRLLSFSLTENAQADLGLDGTSEGDLHAHLACSRRLYRAFDRLTSVLDPARTDRRRRLSLAQAAVSTSAWEDDEPEHLRLRRLLQDIATRLVLAPVRKAAVRGRLKHFEGDIGIDTTAIASWARPPRPTRDLASIEITAGWHHSAGATQPTFGYSATLAVAARRRPTPLHTATHPQLALGLVVDTPGKRIGENAITALTGLTPLGLPAGLLAVDRAYTDQTAQHFAIPARRLGYRLVLDYKQDQRGVQGSLHGAPMVDGNLICPAIPTTLAHATTGLDDKAIRTPSDQLTQQITAREPYYLKNKQGPDPRGAIRLQCPAAGTSPALTCPRFNRLHPKAQAAPAPVDLANPRQRAAHPAARPTVVLPANETRRPPTPDQLPRICRQTTITIGVEDLGKLRQDLHYLTDSWKGAYKPIRAQNEGLNGRLKGHHIDLADPKNRLAHGQAAQTVLVALMVCIGNLHILATWHQQNTSDHPAGITDPTVALTMTMATPGLSPHSRPPPNR
ncbi:hypothetical protein OG589_32825 [Sphaerisporangium sp. NBC_01403]|uniref:hypothetical protein n=1 Tax=Sphaerisporangium sp. NBC_01403 TaxID=2903599 RepID=UPI0032487273